VTTTTVLGDIGVSPALYWASQNSGNYPSNPNFALVAGTPGANNLNTGANFGDAKLTGSAFFETTTYKGAFGTTDWTDGWTEFQPLNKAF
jgi:hypothetical protein